MQISSYFIEGKCLFGSYPTQQQVDELEQKGVIHFVDLTTDSERKVLTPYSTTKTYLSFPIRDNSVPKNIDRFLDFIQYLKGVVESLGVGEKMYIHCRGGHGRAGLVVSSLLCAIKEYSPTESIKYTTIYHKNRPSLKEKWLDSECPVGVNQRKFVTQLFDSSLSSSNP